MMPRVSEGLHLEIEARGATDHGLVILTQPSEKPAPIQVSSWEQTSMSMNEDRSQDINHTHLPCLLSLMPLGEKKVSFSSAVIFLRRFYGIFYFVLYTSLVAFNRCTVFSPPPS